MSQERIPSSTLGRFLGAISIGLLLSGCGSGTQPSSVASRPAASSPPASTSLAKPSSAPSADRGRLSSAASSGAQPLTKVVQALPNQSFGFLPLYVAQAKGFFKDEGLQVEAPLMASSAAVAGVVKGDVDFSVGDTSVRAAMQGAPVKAIIYYYNSPVWEFVAAPNIKSLLDLKGKAIGTSSRGSQEEVASDELLRRAGLNPDKDVTFVVVRAGTQLQSLLAGAIQAMILNVDVAAVAQAHGYHVLKSVQEVGQVLPVPFSGFVTSDDNLQKRPDRVKHWLRATVRALKFIRSNPEESASVVAAALKMDPKIAQQALPSAAEAIDPNDLGGFTTDSFSRSMQLNLEAVGGKAKVTKIEDLASLTLLHEVQRELGVPCKSGFQCK